MSSVWETLSVINVNEHTEKKGQFTYLSWTWAWATVKDHYPEANFTIEDDVIFPDGTMEVRMTVTIESLSYTMWLPVLDFKNQAIKNPDAFAVNSSRMRALVKCIAVGFGLGHYIFAGDSLPQAPSLSDDEYAAVVKVLANYDGFGLLKLQEELGPEKMAEAFNRPERGKKTEFKETMRAVERSAHNGIDEYVTVIAGHIEAQDTAGVLEILEELSDDAWLKKQVWARLTDIQKHHIKSILEQSA